MRSVLPPVLVIAAIATAVCAYHTRYAAQQLPACWPALPLVPIEPFQLTSFALVGGGSPWVLGSRSRTS